MRRRDFFPRKIFIGKKRKRRNDVREIGRILRSEETDRGNFRRAAIATLEAHRKHN